MKLTPHPQSGLNPASFPVDPNTCQPIMPWDYLKVNSIFQVIQNAGMRTAWSDKHAIYTSFNGHGSGGNSIDDFFGPEIDSQAVEPNGVPYPTDTDWAHDDAATKQYDGYKVQAVVNEINGYDHSGRSRVGMPAIFGMNFQTVSVAEKVDSPSTLTRTRTAPTRRGRSSSPATTRARRRRARCWPARWITSTLSCSGWSRRSRPNARHAQVDRDHRHRQARPVAAESAAAEADQGRPDHRRDQRGVDRGTPAVRAT